MDQAYFERLKARQRSERSKYRPAFGLRIHRAISWVGRAEAAFQEGDSDAAFVFYWIAFNAAYAGEISEDEGAAPSARSEFSGYFTKLLAVDTSKTIYSAIWQHFSGPIRVLLENKYVFSPFWSAQRSADRESWTESFDRASSRARKALAANDTQYILEVVFDRLYVLRNQIVHGGSTWNSEVNRSQVRDGVSILKFLVPAFVDLMMDRPDDDWGTPFYPVVPS